MNEDQLYNMSDEELEAQFLAAKAEDEPTEEVVEGTAEEEIEEDTQEDVEEEIAEEEEVEEDLEQPTEDSDDDTSSDDEDDEEEDEDTTEAEEDELDGASEDEDEKPAENDSETKLEEQLTKQEYKFKANGKEYTFSEDEVKEQFPKIFGQAMDYTKKMQTIKPWRKQIDALEQNNVTPDKLNLMIDALKGDKGAIKNLITENGIDILDLEGDEHRYVAKDYGRDDTALAIKDVVDKISSDTEYETTHRVLSKEWDERSWQEMSGNPEMIELLHVDVKSGMYNKVQPIAEKLKVYGRGAKSDLDYYKEAAGIYFTQQEQENGRLAKAEQQAKAQQTEQAEKAKIAEVKERQVKAKTVKKESIKRKAAAPTKKAAGTKKATNYLDDSDEAFEEWYAKIQDL